jgi:hypothetical protein
VLADYLPRGFEASGFSIKSGKVPGASVLLVRLLENLGAVRGGSRVRGLRVWGLGLYYLSYTRQIWGLSVLVLRVENWFNSLSGNPLGVSLKNKLEKISWQQQRKS